MEYPASPSKLRAAGMTSNSPSSGSLTETAPAKSHKALPPLFWYMEMGDWEKATERAKKHPREVKTWATLRTKSGSAVSGTKRLALHHACFKLRSVVPGNTDSTEEDPFMDVCRFILLLIQLYPDAAGTRESRHGCLPVHLAAFASCAPRQKDNEGEGDVAAGNSDGEDDSVKSNDSDTETAATTIYPSSPVVLRSLGSGSVLARPKSIQARSVSEDTHNTNMTAILAEETFTGAQSRAVRSRSVSSRSSPSQQEKQPNVSVSMKSNVLISAKREDLAVAVIDALLDAYPKGIRVDSEGGRLPLHTACAGRATPRVVSTLLQAHPAAARHRNKDGFLPLHLAAHWGVSHPHVAISLLKSYPDSTLGRNRWERTPLEEALCMAGENGRPHQAALVRALRKHPTYWARPPEELFMTPTSHRGSSQLVDMDDTLPDDETSTEEDGVRRYFNSGHTILLEGESERDAARRADSNSTMVDLQTLIRRQQWDEIKARLEVYPHEAGERLTGIVTRGGFVATDGCTPLHYAVERRPPVEVVEALMTAWPEAVMTRMQPGGALPLHVACTWHASASIVSILCQREPMACRAPDELGNVPLHHAAFSGAMVPVVDVLLRTFPKAVLARNLQGSLPADICKRLRHENRKNILVLLTTHKELVVQHSRSLSNGAMGMIAQQAMDLNLANYGPPMSPRLAPITSIGEDKSHESGVEVQVDASGDEMIWI